MVVVPGERCRRFRRLKDVRRPSNDVRKMTLEREGGGREGEARRPRRKPGGRGGSPEGKARRGKPGGGSPEGEARRGKPGGGSLEGEARRGKPGGGSSEGEGEREKGSREVETPGTSLCSQCTCYN